MEENRIPPPEEAVQDMSRLNKRNILVIVAVLAVFTIFSLLRGGSPVKVTTDRELITVSGPEGSTTIAYTDLDAVEYVEAPDYGESADGGIHSKVRWGTWTSSALGTYIAYTSTEVLPCILLKAGDTTVAFNMKDVKTTENFYQTCLALLEQVKQAPAE